jgi:small subunit ribosomal protein S20
LHAEKGGKKGPAGEPTRCSDGLAKTAYKSGVCFCFAPSYNTRLRAKFARRLVRGSGTYEAAAVSVSLHDFDTACAVLPPQAPPHAAPSHLRFYRFDSGLTMANIKSAAKRAKQATKQRAHNMAQRTELRTAIKKIVAAVAKGDKVAAEAAFNTNVATIDSIADKKIIHKNKAARHKSRLTKAIKALGAAA